MRRSARAIADVSSAPDGIDAVVNNAGHALTGAVEDTSIDEARAQLETNFFGVLRVCRAVLPIMRAQGGGYIVNISSLAGVLGLPFSGLYSASKFALEGMSESLRHEARPFGIRVVLIEPGDFRSRGCRRAAAPRRGGEQRRYQAAFATLQGAAGQGRGRRADAGAGGAAGRARARAIPRPRLRYSVGMLGQRIVVPLKRLLPQRLFEWALRQALNLG